MFVAAFKRRSQLEVYRKLRISPQNGEIGRMDNTKQARSVYFLNFIQKSSIYFIARLYPSLLWQATAGQQSILLYDRRHAQSIALLYPGIPGCL